MRLIDHFRQAVRAHPGRVAFTGEGGTLTYGQAAEQAEQIAAGLHALGAFGATAAVLSPNHPLAFACLMGIFRAGGTWVPVNLRNPVPINAALLRLTECRVLFFHHTQREAARELLAQVPTLQWGICFDSEAEPPMLSLPALKARAQQPCPEPDDRPDRVETLFPTGGTTGLSKAAVWTQQTWTTGIAAFWTCLPCDEPPVHLVAAPMTHGAGMMALFMVPMATTHVTLASADALAVMQAIQAHRPTHLYLPPTVIYNLLAHPRVREFDYSSLRYLITAGAPIAPEKLRQAMAVFGPVVCQCFGQAEAPMFLAHLSTRDLLDAPSGGKPDRWASCGRAPAGVDVRTEVMDEAGHLLPPGQTGEIVVRGGLVCAGYFNNPAATAEASRHGWHHTGDVGYLDEQGFLYIVDRKKDMIVTGGFNVYSVEVEQVLLSHPAVEDCAVIGVPDAKWGEAIKAVVQPKPGLQIEPQDLIDLVKARLGAVQAPKSVELTDALPRSPNGKVLKREIRDRYWRGSERAVG